MARSLISVRRGALLLLALTSVTLASRPDALAQDPAPVAAPIATPPEALPAPAPPAPATPTAAAADAAPLAEVALEPIASPWSWGLLTSMIALAVGGISAVLGIWVGRDRSRPVAFAAVMSVLIVSAVSVGAAQSYLDAETAVREKADLQRMLGMVNEIAVASGDQTLADLVAAEGGERVVVPEVTLPTLDPTAAPDAAADPLAEPVPAPTTP